MKFLIKLLALCMALVIGICPALAEAADTVAQPEKPQWTVLVYLCGTDLETGGGMATTNLEEIMKTVPNDQVNVLIQTGGTRQWKAKEKIGLDIDPTKIQRYHYGEGGYTLIEEQPLANMASAETLTDFIKWGVNAYPAEKTMLVVWDHGGGSLMGMVVDELHNKAIMSMDQFEVALKNAGVNFETVVLDTCLMGSLEMAQILQPYAKYLIASEEVVPGKGTAYDAWLQYLYNTPKCTGAQFGKYFCDTVQTKYAELGINTDSQILTFAAIDLSKIDAVTKAFNDMFLEISSLLEDPIMFQLFGYSTSRMQKYSNGMVDLVDMANRTRNFALSNETAGAVLEAVNDAVIHNIKGDARSYSHGLSFFYMPTVDSNRLDHYARHSKNPAYLAFLDAANMNWTAPEWVYEQTPRVPDITRENYVVEAATSLNADGLPQMTITNAKNAVASVSISLLRQESKTEEWFMLGQKTDIEGDFVKGVYTAAFPEEWYTLNDQFCQMSLVEETEKHVLFGIPFLADLVILKRNLEFRCGIMVDGTNSLTALLGGVAADSEDLAALAELAAMMGDVEIYGVWDQDEGNSVQIPSRSVEPVATYAGIPINLLYTRVNLDDMTTQGQTMGETFKFDSSMVIKKKPLPKGNYALYFVATDVFGNKVNSDIVYIDWNGKTAVYSGVEQAIEEEPAAEEAEGGEEAQEDAA